MSARPLRVLLFAEAVTLAHVARIIALARLLDPARYELTVACDPRAMRFLEGEPWPAVPIYSLPSADFARALARGAPVYDEATLQRYVAEDLRLIATHRPDVLDPTKTTIREHSSCTRATHQAPVGMSSCLPDTGEYWDIGRDRNSDALLRQKPKGRFVVRNRRSP